MAQVFVITDIVTVTFNRAKNRVFNIIIIVSELEFQCLATWKDGSDTYIYGGFAGPGIYKRDDMYRCFVSIAEWFLPVVQNCKLYITTRPNIPIDIHTRRVAITMVGSYW